MGYFGAMTTEKCEMKNEKFFFHTLKSVFCKHENGFLQISIRIILILFFSKNLVFRVIFYAESDFYKNYFKYYNNFIITNYILLRFGWLII